MVCACISPSITHITIEKCHEERNANVERKQQHLQGYPVVSLVESNKVLDGSDKMFSTQHVILQHQVVAGGVAAPRVPEQEGKVQHLKQREGRMKYQEKEEL